MVLLVVGVFVVLLLMVFCCLCVDGVVDGWNVLDILLRDFGIYVNIGC